MLLSNIIRLQSSVNCVDELIALLYDDSWPYYANWKGTFIPIISVAWSKLVAKVDFPDLGYLKNKLIDLQCAHIRVWTARAAQLSEPHTTEINYPVHIATYIHIKGPFRTILHMIYIVKEKWFWTNSHMFSLPTHGSLAYVYFAVVENTGVQKKSWSWM